MLKITDKYYADTDKYNWILCKKHIVTESEAKKRKNVNVGDIEYKNISYHVTLEELLIKLYEKYKKSISKDCNLQEYVKELKYMQEDFINQIKSIEKV